MADSSSWVVECEDRLAIDLDVVFVLEEALQPIKMSIPLGRPAIRLHMHAVTRTALYRVGINRDQATIIKQPSSR